MTIARMSFRSQVLGKGTSLNIYLPENMTRDTPVMYLLHGYSDDCNAWLDATSLARFAGDYPFMIVMPQVELSYYTNMAYGDDYWDFIAIELPQRIKEWYGVKSDPAKTFVAGLSMGGYGAFKWGMQAPEKFRAAASMSGALDIVSLWERDQSRNKSFGLVFGDIAHLSASTDNLFQLFSDKLKTEQAPAFLQICGTEDFLYEDNQTFKKKATDALANFTYEEGPGGHTWEFWNQEIQRVLAFFAEFLEK
ncbi:alpha/beta hydrolase [Enterococcus sp. LJL99]